LWVSGINNSLKAMIQYHHIVSRVMTEMSGLLFITLLILIACTVGFNRDIFYIPNITSEAREAL
jgi:hypothetical protein